MNIRLFFIFEDHINKQSSKEIGSSEKQALSEDQNNSINQNLHQQLAQHVCVLLLPPTQMYTLTQMLQIFLIIAKHFYLFFIFCFVEFLSNPKTQFPVGNQVFD